MIVDYSSAKSELESQGFNLFLKEGDFFKFKSKFKKNNILITMDWCMGGFIKKITINTKGLEKEYNDIDKYYFEEIKKHINQN